MCLQVSKKKSQRGFSNTFRSERVKIISSSIILPTNPFLSLPFPPSSLNDLTSGSINRSIEQRGIGSTKGRSRFSTGGSTVSIERNDCVEESPCKRYYSDEYSTPRRTLNNAGKFVFCSVIERPVTEYYGVISDIVYLFPPFFPLSFEIGKYGA